MFVSISARHGHISEPVKTWMRQKIDKLQRFRHRITAAHVVIDLNRQYFPHVELQLVADGAQEFCASHQGKGLFTTLDTVIRKAEVQLRRSTRKRKRRRKVFRHSDAVENPLLVPK